MIFDLPERQVNTMDINDQEWAVSVRYDDQFSGRIFEKSGNRPKSSLQAPRVPQTGPQTTKFARRAH